jgi:hypothetical protein
MQNTTPQGSQYSTLVSDPFTSPVQIRTDTVVWIDRQASEHSTGGIK